MRISPVTGTPALPQLSNSGMSAEKLSRIKNIAAGVASEASQEVPKARMPQRSLRMHTVMPGSEVQTTEATVDPEQSAISDPNVQTNGVEEAIQPLSPQFAELAKRRRALQVKEREIADREKALTGPTRAELEAKIKTQPLSVLQELGVTYDQLTNDILAAQGNINPDIQSIKAELKALKEGVDKTLSDKDAAAEKAVLMEMRRNVNQLSSQGDEFEMVRETQSQSDVIELIHRTYKQTGEVLDVEEAMKLVEEELATEALKIAKLKKVQGKLTPVAPAQPAPQQGMRTLTNKDSAKPSMDRRQRAILAMQGQLKR